MSKYGFKELIVWQKAKALAVDIYELTAAGRITHDFSLVDQIRRSAVSVPSNIAEGLPKFQTPTSYSMRTRILVAAVAACPSAMNGSASAA